MTQEKTCEAFMLSFEELESKEEFKTSSLNKILQNQNDIYKELNKIKEKTDHNQENLSILSGEIVSVTDIIEDLEEVFREFSSSTTETTENEKREQERVQPMSKIEFGKQVARKSATDISTALKRGAAQGVVASANKSVLKAIEDRLGENYPEYLKTEAGRKMMEMVIPSLIMTICNVDVEDRIPQKDRIMASAELALNATSAEAVENTISFFMQELMPVLAAYSNAGQNLIEEPAETETDFAEEIARLSAREKVKA